MALDLGRAILRHKPNDDSPDNRNYDDPRAELILRRTAKMKGPDMIEREIGKKPDQIVEKKCNNAGDDANQCGQERNEAYTETGDRLAATDVKTALRNGAQCKEPLYFI
jgi:hypothetical protein